MIVLIHRRFTFVSFPIPAIVYFCEYDEPDLKTGKKSNTRYFSQFVL